MHGLRDFGSDSKWLIKTSTKKTKYSFVSYGQETKTKKVKRDVLKMIPFSFFLIIPGAELALPAYLKIFPNSLPSQFESDSDRLNARKARKKQQETAAARLKELIPLRLQELIDDPSVSNEDRVLLKEFLDVVTGKESLPTGFLSFRFMLTKYLNRGVLGPEELINVIQFLGKEPLTGFNMLNKLMRTLRCREFDPCANYLRQISSIVLRR